MSFRPAGRLLFMAVVAAFLSSCVDGGSPTAIDLPHTVALSVAPVFAVAASAAEAGALTRARVTVRDAADGTELGSVQQDIDPNANEWTLELTLELTSGQTLSVILLAELASVAQDGAETVEWSGRTATFEIVAASEPRVLREIALYRGPLDNLDVTAVTLTLGATSLLEGESAWLTTAVQGGGEGTKIYYASLDPGVATVDALGHVTAHVPGTARVAAIVGPAADTLSFSVNEVVLPEPDEIAQAVTPQVDYAAQEVVSTLEDAAGAAAIGETLTSLGTALSSGDGAASVAAFGHARAAWESYGDPVLRILDGPQLSLIEITLIHAADALGIAFG